MAELTPAGALASRVLPPTPTAHTTPANTPEAIAKLQAEWDAS